MNLKNKKVLVTGGAGFLGSYVVESLREHGCSEIFIPRRQEYDLVKMEAVKRLYQDAQPDIVVHLAAVVGGIGANMANPGIFFYDNLMMGAQMIEIGRRMGIEKFVGLGTVCAYPKHTPVPFQEKDIWNGYPEETNAPYALAKKMVLVQGQAYRQQYGFNAIYLLPTNLYGPRDNFDPNYSHVIPALIRKVAEAQRQGKDIIEIWGTGSASREFLYAKDAAEGIVLATEQYDKPEPVNLGGNLEITVRDLLTLICSLMNYAGEIRWDNSKPDGQPRRRVDASLARKEFGFYAKTPFQEGLEKTIAWYLNYQRTAL